MLDESSVSEDILALLAVRLATLFALWFLLSINFSRDDDVRSLL